MKKSTYTTSYGRKLVRGGYKRNTDYHMVLLMTWGVSFLIGVLIGLLIFWMIISL